eukprot:Amastigsp_a676481_41.p3 type:complete len:100 gc:universal Amastigsp_a676481_41:251-550(+)
MSGAFRRRLFCTQRISTTRPRTATSRRSGSAAARGSPPTCLRCKVPSATRSPSSRAASRCFSRKTRSTTSRAPGVLRRRTRSRLSSSAAASRPSRPRTL